MGEKLRSFHVPIALALIATVAIAGTAIGGESANTAVSKKALNKAVKKEVAKQIGKATGPPGANGTDGVDGINGIDGTARAYARVQPACAPECTIYKSKGVTSVTREAVGLYCVIAPGIDGATTSPAVAADWQFSANPEGNTSAMASTSVGCAGGEGFHVYTERQPVITVRNAAGDGTTEVAGNAVPADDVGFSIVIP
jgi:hypothetical protein